MKQFYRYSTKIVYSIFALLVLAVIWGFYLKKGTPSSTLATILTIVFVVHGMVLFLGILKRNRLQVLLFLVAVTTGYYGFRYLPTKDYSVLNAIYSTFRLFILDADPVFTKDPSLFSKFPLAIEIARWSAAAYTISTLFSLVYTLFHQSFKLFWYGILGKHIVVSGFHKKSLTLIESFRKEHKKVVLLAEEISEAQREYLQELGVIVFIGRQGDPLLYKKSRLLRAEYFIIFHEEDSKNLNEILAINEYVNKDWSLLHLKQVIFHLKSNQSFDLFEDLEKDLDIQAKAGRNISLKPFNLHRLVAEELFDEFPLYTSYEERVRDPQGKPLHLLFIGFGQTGQHLAVQAIERAHYINPELLRITVLDKDSEKVKKEWYDNYPASNKVVDIYFHPIDIEIESTYNFLKSQTENYTHIFVCLKDDAHDLKEGIRLAKKIPDIPIYLKINEEAQISHWLQNNRMKYDKLHLFGNNDAILNYDYVVDDQFEELAKMIHESYRKSKEQESKKAQVKWDQLSTFLKESNRNQVNHAFTKLMLLGMKAMPHSEALNSGLEILSEKQFKMEAEKVLEEIAAAEHQRWNAFHFLRGWDILPDVREKIKDADLKLHGCLVSYADLEEIYKLTGEDYQVYDRDVVLKLHETMQKLGYEIVKL